MNLSEIIKSSELSNDKQNALFLAFDDYARITNEWKAKADLIKVNNEDDITAMKEADNARKIIKNVRVEIEHKRKELKESSLREGQMIDKIAKSLKDLIEPIEQDLTQKAQYAEIKQKEREDILRKSRNLEIKEYSEFVPYGLDLAKMNDDDYAKLLNGAKLQYANKIAEQERLEAERVERQRLEAEEQERIRVENAKLRLEAEARERELREEREKLQKMEREKAEKELQIQEEQNKNKNASDVEKLELLIDRLINLEYPEVSLVNEYLGVLHDVKYQINQVINTIRQAIKVIKWKK